MGAGDGLDLGRGRGKLRGQLAQGCAVLRGILRE
jgi:hypothetical protein